MRVLWCWRCRADVPMLDEEEYAVVDRLFREGMRATKEFRQQHGLPLQECPIDERFRPVREAYERFTGVAETNHKAVMHHRVAIYGPPCPNCGRILRTPQSSNCFECGTPRSAP